MGDNLMIKIVKMFKKLLPFSDTGFDKNESYETKVLKIMNHEKDFSALYDYDKIVNLNEVEQMKYLAEVTKNYILMRENLIKRGALNVEK